MTDTMTAPSFTGTMTNNAGQDNYWLTKGTDGSVTKELVERSHYVVPPQGSYRLRLLRFSEPFQMKKSEQYLKPGEDPMQWMMRIELQIIGGQGDGRKINTMVTQSLGERSKLGQIARAAIKRDLGPGEKFDLYSICHHADPNNDNHDFLATLKPSEQIDEQTGKPKYCNIVDKTIGKVDAAGGSGWVD